MSMAEKDRPLSPHLQIYRFQLHMVMSVLHRITGVALGAGTILLVWWLMALAAGPSAYETFSIIAASPLGQLVLFGFSFALLYHLLNGIRHLYWDTGQGFELSTTRLSGLLVMTSAIAATIAAWVVAYYLLGKI
jgi:succinate dehydrogenase / fumarate reductase cytochrome b subunit